MTATTPASEEHAPARSRTVGAGAPRRLSLPAQEEARRLLDHDGTAPRSRHLLAGLDAVPRRFRPRPQRRFRPSEADAVAPPAEPFPADGGAGAPEAPQLTAPEVTTGGSGPEQRVGLLPARADRVPVRLLTRPDRWRQDSPRSWHLPAGWPLTALLVGFPLWWALGLSTFIFPLLAVPMALELRRRRPLRLPRGFALWALFLVWVVLSLVMLPVDPVGTLAGSWSGRLISVVVTLAEYLGVTVTLLYVGNLTEREMPQLRIVRMLGVLFLVTVVGGLLGMLVPTLQFTAPLEYLLPGGLRTDPYIRALVHPAVSQVQTVLGYSSGRPAAPFGYTNFWGNNLSILLAWFVVGWWTWGSPVRRVWCWVIVAATMAPVVYSLNRALWAGLLLTVVYVAVRLALHGRLLAVGAIGLAGAVGVVVFMLSPLQLVVQERLANPHSNGLRSYLSAQALHGANQSPVLGWGGTRKIVGSDRSISVGKTPDCPLCGNFAIGSNGQIWTVIFYYGYVGAALFLGFFLASMWFYRRDGTPVGQAGLLVVGLTFLYMFFYNSLPAALTLTMISIALLWRSDDARRGRAPA